MKVLGCVVEQLYIAIYTKQFNQNHEQIGEMSEPGLWSYVKESIHLSVVGNRMGSNPILVKEYSITPPISPIIFCLGCDREHLLALVAAIMFSRRRCQQRLI
jgi:hypothetical protein